MGYAPFNPYNSRLQKGSKYAKHMKERKVNKAVRHELKKSKPSRNKTKAQANRGAIITLANQVKELQLASYGAKQYQQQMCFMAPNPLVPETYPTLENPFLFAANSFYNNTPIFRGYVDPSGDALFENAGPTTPGDNYTLTKRPFQANIQDQYEWNALNNEGNNVSPVEYLPISAKYTFRFSGNLKNQPGLGYDLAHNVRYRITFFRVKRLPTPNLVKDISLPTRLGAYWRMCSDNLVHRNYFSKSYHEVISDKFISFAPPPDLSGNVAVFYDYKVNIPFKDESIKPLLEDVPPGAEFWTNVPAKDIIWCLISTNFPNTTYQRNELLNIQIERQLKWRDRHGVIP